MKAESSKLVRYDAMVHAIAECHRVDEVKDIRDKAMAMQVYAKQAMNVEAERKATEIRLRAERRAGELIAKLERGAGPGRGKKVSGNGTSLSAALGEAGVSRQKAQRWQELANVPKKQFEDALRDPEKKPTTSGILAASKPAPKMDDDALWIWGRLRDFERMAIQQRDAESVFKAMTETMQDDMRRILPVAIDFLNQLSEATDGKA